MATSKKLSSTSITEGPLLKNLIIFALPLIATGLLQTAFNAADTIVVGRFAANGKLAVGAVGATGSLINMILNILLGLSVGAGVCVAQAVGAKDYKSAKETTHTALLLAIFFGVIVAIFGFTFCRTFLSWMKTPAEQIDLSTLYLRIYFIGTPFNIVYNFMASVMRSTGDTKHPLIFLTIAGATNCVLNLIFVTVFGMSVDGVAIATIASQALSAVMIVTYMMRKKDFVCRISFKELKLSKDKARRIIRIGLPAGLQSFLFSISNVTIQSSVNSFGADVVSGNSAAGNIEGFIWIAMNAFQHSSMTFIGQHVGARKTKRIPKILLLNLLLVTGIGATLGALAYFFRHFLLNIYLPGEETVIAYGAKRMTVIATTYFICGILDVFTGSIRGLGDSVSPMILTLVGTCGLRLLWVFTIFQMYRTQYMLYASYPVSWIITDIAYAIDFVIVYRRLVRRQALENASFSRSHRSWL